MLSANWYFDESFSMSLAVSSSKPYYSNGVVEDVVSAPGMSVLAGKESSAAVGEMIPPDQEALGMILLLMKVMRPAQESSRLVGSWAAIVPKVAPDWAVDTQGAVIVVSFVLGER